MPSVNVKKSFRLKGEDVEKYELVNSENQTSGASAVSRGAVGGLLLGPLGLLFGATAKKNAKHQVKIYWKDGEKSLLEVDGQVYAALQNVLL